MNLFDGLKPELSGFDFFFIHGIMEIIEISNQFAFKQILMNGANWFYTKLHSANAYDLIAT